MPSEDFWIGGARGETPAFARAKARVDRHQFLPDVELLQLVEYREQMITSLSPREHQVLHEIGRGLTNREIGVRLGITEKTVKNTVTVVLAKLGLQRRAGAGSGLHRGVGGHRRSGQHAGGLTGPVG